MDRKAIEQCIQKYQNAGCSMFQLEAPVWEDYPYQTDMLVGFTVIPELWRRAHDEEPCHIADLAQCGETFWYVKIDGILGFAGSAFRDREEIEDALDEALAEALVGCVIGAGTGRRYSYVDLVLLDEKKGHEIIRKVLKGGKITERTWILSFDYERKEKWDGIWDNTPAPPY